MGKDVIEIRLLKTEESKTSSQAQACPSDCVQTWLIPGLLFPMSATEQTLAGGHIQEEDLHSVTCLLVRAQMTTHVKTFMQVSRNQTKTA